MLKSIHTDRTYHEGSSKRTGPLGADEIRHSAVHPAHDVHVHCTALHNGRVEGKGAQNAWLICQVRDTCAVLLMVDRSP